MIRIKVIDIPYSQHEAGKVVKMYESIPELRGKELISAATYKDMTSKLKHELVEIAGFVRIGTTKEFIQVYNDGIYDKF